MFQHKIKFKALLLLLVGMLFYLPGCEIDEVPDPNNLGVDQVTDGATLSHIQNLVDGIEFGMRERLGTYYDAVSMVGREYYRFSSADPRFTSELLGKGSSTLDNNTFYTTQTFALRYQTVKNANILITAIENTSASISAAQASAAIGFAKTIKAHQLLMVLNQQYTCGVRVDVADPDNLGAFLSLDASLDAIKALLDEGFTDLGAGSGAEFPFRLSSGFSGFNNPTTFAQFNRALAARVAVYRQDWAGALDALNKSFADPAGDLNAGVYHPYGTEKLNELFFTLGASGEARVAHPSFVADAEAGDTRLNKVVERSDTLFVDDLASNYDVWVYTSNTQPVPLIRNEELVLIKAEAEIQLNNLSEGTDALNEIRNAAGLGDYAGAGTKDALIDELLKQRRYSLFGEGHRWIDLRRYGRLGTLPIDRPDDDVFDHFPRPATENESCE